MTVQGETPTVAGVDLDAAEKLFTGLFNEYWPRVRAFIWTRLHVRQTDLAEDLAQETLICFWNDYVSTGKLRDPNSAFGLLATIARGVIANHFRRMRAGEQPLDFTDAANTPMFPVTHFYAPDSPHLAGLALELEAALERMTDASQAWRDKHQESYTLRRWLDDTHFASRGGVTPERLQQIAEAAEAAVTAEAGLLASFRQACQRVGQLRAEMEAKAGPDWRASMGGMPSADFSDRIKEGCVRRDPSVTHCPEGHALENDNVSFTEDGGRRCRACRADRQAKRSAAKPRKRETPARMTASPEALASARALLTDPAHDHIDFKDMAKQIGLHEETLRRRLPDVVAARQERRDKRPAHLKNPKLAQARALLLDDQCELTVPQIAKVSGVSVGGIYKALGDALAERTRRQEQRHRKAAAKASALLMDPANPMTVTEIATVTGFTIAALYRAVPDAIAARRTAREAAAAVPAGAGR